MNRTELTRAILSSRQASDNLNESATEYSVTDPSPPDF